MFRLKLRSPIALPPSGSSARLPALLLPVLAAAALLQLVLPYGDELPPAGVPARGKQVAPPPEVPRVLVPAALADRSVFSPVAAAAGDAPVPTDVLGGAVIAGTIRHGRQLYAVVQERGGRIRQVAPGGTVAGWRISALTPTGARLSRGSEQFTVAYGAIPTGPAAPAPEDSEDGQ